MGSDEIKLRDDSKPNLLIPRKFVHCLISEIALGWHP